MIFNYDITLNGMESEILLKKGDLKELSQFSTRELKPISRKKDVKVELVHEENLPTVTAAPEKIKNLLNTLPDGMIRGSQKARYGHNNHHESGDVPWNIHY